jgi:glycosyltransferase involved in cell wall biosynthesis
MPAWNAARFIEEALRSILDQTVAPAAIVVVDDGSTDETASLAAAVDPCVTVLHREHAGIGVARTAGVAATTTEFVAFLDADDLWLPPKLERQLAMMDADPSVEAVFCLTDEFYDPVDGPPVGVRQPLLGFAGVLPSAALLRRDLLDRLGPFDTSAVGEWVGWWARARAGGVHEEFVPLVLLRRRIHAHNNSHLLYDQGKTFLGIARAHRHAVRARNRPGMSPSP